MTSEDIHCLRQFFGAYFHQDWSLDGPDADAIVDRFIGDASDMATLARVADMIDAFREGMQDEAQLERTLQTELWCEFVPSAVGMSTNEWLQHVSTRLRTATK